MKVFVVVPNWNGATLLTECLNSLQSQSLSSQIVVVDNGSHDDSVYIVEESFPEVALIKLRKNRGFAGGVNVGIDFALKKGADAVALFNNDAFADKNWLKNLADTMSSTGADVVTSKFMQADKRHFDSTGDYYSVYGIAFPRGRNTIDKGQYDKREEVFGASGGASLYSSNLFRQIGLFDERFFAYFEDVDISFRAQLAGLKVIYEPSAVAYHHIGATSSKLGNFIRYHSMKNFLILFTKNMPLILYLKFLPFFSYQFLRTTARSFIDLKPHIWLKAVLVFTIYLPGILFDRFAIQRSRQVLNKELEKKLFKNKPTTPPAL